MSRDFSEEKLRLLIVDDDDVDREKVRRMIAASSLRAETIEVATGEAALVAIRESIFDCVLLDYHLTDGIGTELASEIRSSSQRACPIILITGIGNENVAVQAMREGVYDYLSKHYLEPDQLRATIERAIRRAELENSLKESQERLEWLGLYDSLTTLPNRNLFFDRLDQAMHAVDRGQASFALLMIDLNLFKEINDTLGHTVGDQVLTEIGRRLKREARVSDSYARLGGDEFAGILMGTKSAGGARLVAERLHEAIKAPILIDDKIVTVTASTGIALAPQHGRNRRDLLAAADQAMYRAKRSSRGFEFATIGDAGQRNAGSSLGANQIADAIDRRLLFMHFQPKIDLETGALVGAEALVRWNHSDKGIVAAADFVPSVERTAMIGPLTFLTLDLALGQAKNWVANEAPFRIAVNLSQRMLDDENLAQRVLAVLARYDLPATILTLEITESALMRDPGKAGRIVSDLVAAGVSISLDDFGAGYTSLSYLSELEISEIKLDRSFVEGLHLQPRNQAIIRSVAALSRSFGTMLVAEGIEDCDNMRILKDLGCDLGQGFGIGHPVSADQFEETWLKTDYSAQPHEQAQSHARQPMTY